VIKVSGGLQRKLNPVRGFGSLGVFNGIRRMYQAFARDDRPGQVQIKFFVMVKMREFLTAIAQSGKAIIASRCRLFFDAKLGKTRDQLFT
jgi:hypothetical protein